MGKTKCQSFILIISLLSIIFSTIGMGGINRALAASNNRNMEILGNGNVETYGFLDIIKNDDNSYIIGTTGLRKILRGINLYIEGMPEDMMLVYRAHMQTYGDIPKKESVNTWKDPDTGKLWLKAPAYLGVVDELKGIEGIQMRLIDKTTGKDYVDYNIRYQLHVQGIGWMEQVANGEFAGTKGKSLRSEAIAMQIFKGDRMGNHPMMPISPRYLELRIRDIEKNIKSSSVYAMVNQNATLYNSINGRIIGRVKQGTQVEIIQDRNYAWYQVNTGTNTGWLKGGNLSIPNDPPTNTQWLTRGQLESYINYKKFSSPTPYFIWVDIDRQLTHIFKGSTGNWKLKRTMVCATGKNESPTIRGIFEIGDRGRWFYSNRLKSGAKNWIRFYNSYLFHSIAFDSRGNIQDNTLGNRASAGCVRLSVEDSEYLYENIPEQTTVWIN